MSLHKIELLDQLHTLLREATTNQIAFDSKPLEAPIILTKKLQVQNQYGVPIDYIILSIDEVKSLVELFNQILESK